MASAIPVVRALAGALLLISAATVCAAVPPEIAHLLDAIEHSGCTFVRNGERHTAAEARSHMQRKYDYAAGLIATAEEFIRYIGSGSSITGSVYLIECSNRSIPSADWLADELRSYRRGHREAD